MRLNPDLKPLHTKSCNLDLTLPPKPSTLNPNS